MTEHGPDPLEPDPLDELLRSVFAAKASEFDARRAPGAGPTADVNGDELAVRRLSRPGPRTGLALTLLGAVAAVIAGVALASTLLDADNPSERVVLTDSALGEQVDVPIEDPTATPRPTESASPSPTATATATATATVIPGPDSPPASMLDQLQQTPEPTPEVPEAQPTRGPFIEPSDPEPTRGPFLAPTPEPFTPVPGQQLGRGTLLCTTNVPIDDPLNVREAPGVGAAIVTTIGAATCSARLVAALDTVGWQLVEVVEQTTDANGAPSVQLRRGWAASQYLAPASTVDSPEAALVQHNDAVVIWNNAGTPQCVVQSETEARCSASTWIWVPPGPCAQTADGGWQLESSGEVTLTRSAEGWTVTDERLLVVGC